MAIRQVTLQNARGGAYTVTIGSGLLADDLPRFVAERGFSQVIVITNDTLAPLYGEQLAARMPGGALIHVPDGERHKTLATVQTIYNALLTHGADRSTLIVALGGGVVGDMAGYAAATFMRGLPLIQVPTSLLAMVDASLGGKVGVDLPQGKNLVGAFKDPLAVFADTSVLATLPAVELRCGMAEVVKAALVADPALLGDLVPEGAKPIDEIIERAVQVKAAIVEQDPFEKGLREHLNLGHTFAHALEQVSGFAWRHGEAVSVGLVAAARVSELAGTCREGLAGCIEQTLTQLGLPVMYADYHPEHLWDAMRHDKKSRHGMARFVLLHEAGKPVVRDDLSPDLILNVLHSLRKES